MVIPTNLKWIEVCHISCQIKSSEVWHSYSEYLFGIAVAIPTYDSINAVLGLLQISHSYSKFDAAIPTVYLEQLLLFQSGLASMHYLGLPHRKDRIPQSKIMVIKSISPSRNRTASSPVQFQKNRKNFRKIFLPFIVKRCLGDEVGDWVVPTCNQKCM